MNNAAVVRFLILSVVITCTALAGPLSPPAGPVAPTPGPEPRTPINSTNTPGDANSVFRITQPGSYYLTANLTGVANKHGIEIASSDVTIDLNGFTVVGFPGSLKGISVDFAYNNLSVRNGIVEFWSGRGVDLRDNWSCFGHRVEGVTVRACGDIGILTGTSSVLVGCISSNNTLEGIISGNNSQFRDCVTRSNGAIGLSVGDGSTISFCVSEFNAGSGISAGTASTVQFCSARENAGHGIQTSSGASVSNSPAANNGHDGIALGSDCSAVACTTFRNKGNGISAVNDSRIRDNTCNENGFTTGFGAGILAGSGNRIEANHCADADWGIRATGSGNVIVRNTCSGNTTANWDFAANNVYGPILNRAAPATAAFSGDTATSTLGSTDANANFTH